MCLCLCVCVCVCVCLCVSVCLCVLLCINLHLRFKSTFKVASFGEEKQKKIENNTNVFKKEIYRTSSSFNSWVKRHFR